MLGSSDWKGMRRIEIIGYDSWGTLGPVKTCSVSDEDDDEKMHEVKSRCWIVREEKCKLFKCKMVF